MKNIYKNLLLTILPLFLFFLARIYTDAYTPYYLNGHYDPAYVYLLNSLNLAQLSNYGVGHVDHPGTPLQVLGAIVVKLYFNFSSSSDNMVTDVLIRPENYLNIINLTLTLINSLVLFLFGLILFKILGNILQAVFLQLTPFFSCNVFCKLTEVTPENLLIGVILILLIISFKFVHDSNLTEKKIMKYIVAFAIITGFGISVKLNFIPLAIIPAILLRKNLNKILFLVFSSAAFLFFVIPAILNYSYFFGWVKELIVHEGIYGGGDANIINTSNYIRNIKSIFITEKLFGIIYLLILCFLFFVLLIRKNKVIELSVRYDEVRRHFRFLAGIFLAMTFEILMVAKHFVMRYMLPSLMLAISGLFLVIYIYAKVYQDKFKKLKINYAFIFLIILFIAISFRKYKIIYEDTLNNKNKTLNTQSFINTNYRDEIIITGYRSYNKEVALFLATDYAGSQNVTYKKLLNQLFPEKIIYKDLSNEIYNLSKSSQIREALTSGKKIIFLSNYLNSVDSLTNILKSNCQFEKVSYENIYKNNDTEENVYEIKLE